MESLLNFARDSKWVLGLMGFQNATVENYAGQWKFRARLKDVKN